MSHGGVYAATATLLGFGADLTASTPALQSLVVGILGASVPIGLVAWFNRKKSKADTASVIAEATAELLAEYRTDRIELLARLSKAEAAAVAALVNESECRARLSALEETVRQLAPTQNATTTTTVSVTHP